MCGKAFFLSNHLSSGAPGGEVESPDAPHTIPCSALGLLWRGGLVTKHPVPPHEADT